MPESTSLEIESNETLYSVRPRNNELPKGVNFNADGIVKAEVVKEYWLAQSISTVPGSVIRSLILSLFRSVALEPPLERSSRGRAPALIGILKSIRQTAAKQRLLIAA